MLFDSIVFAGRDINRMVTAVTQALCNQTGITFIRFDLLSLLGKLGSRREDDTFDPGSCANGRFRLRYTGKSTLL